MLNSTAASKPLHQRQSSRSNSTSSSSVVTVQRTASLSSRSGPRTPHTKVRSQSPNESIARLSVLSPNSLYSDQNHKQRTSGTNSRPNSVGGLQEVVGNLNRWSQSTSSSKSSGQGQSHNRKGSFSRRLSFGGSGSFGSLKNLANPQSPPSRNVLTKPRQGPGQSPQRDLPVSFTPLEALPPIVTLPALSQVVDATESPSTTATVTPATTDLLTPSTYGSYPADYFGVKWKKRSPATSRLAEQLEPVSSTSQLPPNDSVDSSVSSSRASSPQNERLLLSRNGRSRDHTPQASHSRNREDSGKGSGDTVGGSSSSSIRSAKERVKRRRTPSQKTMLSKALQKANTAVLLDNAQNFEGAVEAYADACQLLQQVMLRSAGDDDKKKLEAIRNTYTNRITELRNLDFASQTTEGKALPERPMSNETINQDSFSPVEDDEEDTAIIETATATRITNSQYYVTDQRQPRSLAPSQIPPRRQSLLPSAFDEEVRFMAPSPGPQQLQQRSWSKSPRRDRKVERTVNLAPPIEPDYMPPPLSPRRPLSPKPPLEPTLPETTRATRLPPPELTQVNQHSRDTSTESTSWLDTIDESGGSSASSVHSRSSSLGLRRKQIRPPSGATEAEFDAALDAAVEAAYDDGFEVAEDDEDHFAGGDLVSNARRNIALAKQKVREAEREAAVALAKEKEKRQYQHKGTNRDKRNSTELEYVDDEAEEEERLLEEMTKGYVMDDVEFDLQSKSALPRKSDSSGFSGRTWGSSIGSNTTTAGTSLSTVAESVVRPSLNAQLQSKLPPPPPPHPPPISALPAPPAPTSNPPAPPPRSAPPPRPPSFGSSSGPGVRDRRLSGQNAKRLKIETNAKMPSGNQAPKTQPPSMPSPSIPVSSIKEGPKSAAATPQARNQLPAAPSRATPQVLNPQPATPLPISSVESGLSDSPATPALTKATSQDSDDGVPPIPPSPARTLGKVSSIPDYLRKNMSSSSLKTRNLSVSAPDVPDISPSTPGSSTFPPNVETRKGVTTTAPVLPMPTGATFTVNSLPTGGLYLFENNFHSPTSPGSPNALAANAPIPLEPCPESFLLRPFWIMRCLYQTIAHPRGGYVSTKLFIPRDVWRVKNVKIKGVDEKVSNCDLLTAALLNLSKVDTLDADAVLEEMQTFESVLDQVQTNLSKKLGSEVGVQSTAALFKGSPANEEPGSHSEALSSKSTNAPGKSYLASWRKLRSKNSGAGLTTTFTTTMSKEGGKETLSMNSLPMTSFPSQRFAKRNVNSVRCEGPNANYMGALARLFDAVQVLDQIARQVEDPGLKHSSQTHTGIELSARHAAEFFGFYVCRFALNDVGMMLDKFIKRGSEWVLL